MLFFDVYGFLAARLKERRQNQQKHLIGRKVKSYLISEVSGKDLKRDSFGATVQL